MPPLVRDPQVRQALGPEPLEDARHLLPPLALPALSLQNRVPDGPAPHREFVVDLLGAGTAEAGQARTVLTPERRAALHFPRVWGRLVGRDRWVSLEEADARTGFDSLALCWELSPLLLGEGAEATRALGRYLADAGAIATLLHRTAAPREEPEKAARRASRLTLLRERFARSVELRLMPSGRLFPARDVWRAAYALGLEWGDLNLLHWRDPASHQRLFTLSAVGLPGYFLPERAAQGEGVNGIALGFELPHCPAPVAVWDRMAVALAYLRQKLGGHPLTREGRELNGDELEAERDLLEQTVAEMADAGIVPGSAEAARMF